jgi:hypothetical protein
MTVTFHRNAEPTATEPGRRSHLEVQRDFFFLCDEYDRLLDQHPDRWIAIYECKVVATAKDLQELREFLGSAGIGNRSAVVEFMDSNPPLRIF